MSTDALDHVLALQLTVAWAGERQGEPPGLGWWETSLADPDGGADFLRRMFPRTHVWAALGSMREAARRADAKARAQSGRGDRLWTLFHFGFEWDEALDERFEHHQRQAVETAETADPEGAARARRDPAAVFGPRFAVTGRFDRDAFEKYLAALSPGAAHEIAPGGRQLAGPFRSPDEAAGPLARALLPLVPSYPLPFYPAPEGR